MKLTAHILLEVEVDDGTPASDVALAVTAGAERAAATVRGDGFRAVDFSVATSPMARAPLLDALRSLAAREAGATP